MGIIVNVGLYTAIAGNTKGLIEALPKEPATLARLLAQVIAEILHADIGNAMSIVALAAIGIAGMALWALVVVIKALLARRG